MVQARQPSVDQLEDSACQLDPRVEGRILELTDEVGHTLDTWSLKCMSAYFLY